MVVAAVCPAVAQDRALNGLVDPMAGTGNDHQGDTIPGPTLPAGSIHPSPETISANTSNAGYDHEVDNVIGEGFPRGVPGVDWRKAADVVLFAAHERRRPRYLVDGFFAVGDRSPEGEPQRARSGSATVGMALNDYYASVVAEGAGRTEEAAALRKPSGNWRNVWDASATSDRNSGFVRPRFADGTFQPNNPKRGWNGKKHNNFGLYEGAGWIYSYATVYDIPGMVAIMGGRDAFVRRLQHAFDAGLIDIPTNLPSRRRGCSARAGAPISQASTPTGCSTASPRRPIPATRTAVQ